MVTHSVARLIPYILVVLCDIASCQLQNDFVYGLAIPEDALNRPETPQRNTIVSKNGSLVFGDIPENRCYCTYGHEEGVCDRNETCIRHPLAACFHAVEQIHNKVERRMETWHKYGCAPLEKGSDASHLTCNGFKSSHIRPKSIACCYTGNYCNKDIEPPPYANINELEYDESVPTSSAVRFLRSGPLKIIGLLCAAALLVVGIFTIIRKGVSNYGKEAKEDVEGGEKQPMLFEDSGSGSGSGLTTLNQRTIAQDLEIKKVIGRGRYGEVRKAKYRGSYVAVKTFYTTDEESWKNERDVYQTQMLNHENILQFVAADISSEDSITHMLLITDYHELGSLSDYLRRENEILSVHEALRLAHSSICGIEHLHNAVHGTGSRRKPEIAHRDIKSKNIIVKREGVCCIADFGLAVRCEDHKIIPAKVNIQVGTKRYMAPEVLSKKLMLTDFQQFKMADIYSFALVMWEITRRIECLESADNIANGATSVSSGQESGLGSSIRESEQVYEPKAHLQKRSVDMSTRAKPYEPPFEGMVEHDPSFEEMKAIVCDQNKRPTVEKEWRDPEKNPTIYRMTSLMIDCWNDKPYHRHTALKVKKELLRLLKKESAKERMLEEPPSTQTTVTPPTSVPSKKETDSGNGSGGSSKDTDPVKHIKYPFVGATPMQTHVALNMHTNSGMDSGGSNKALDLMQAAAF